jgi:hypothetical protein
MVRLIVPLLIITGCFWIVFYGVPDDWRKPLWHEIRNWAQVATAAVFALSIVSLAIMLFT